MRLAVGFSVYREIDWLLSEYIRHETAGFRVLSVLGNPYVGRARNKVTRMFLEETDCDKLIQVDVDIAFNRENIERVASHDLPVVGGTYFKKQFERVAVCEGLPGET